MVLIVDFSATYLLGAEEERRRQSRSGVLLVWSGTWSPPFFKSHLQFGASSGGTQRSRPGRQMSRRRSQEHHSPLERVKRWGAPAQAAAAEVADTGAGGEGRELLFAHF